MIYKNRDIENTILKESEVFPCLTILGARQVGKTTTIRHLFPKVSFVSLDDIDELDLALSNPKGFLITHPWPLIIDEVQRAPKLLSIIKKYIDEERYNCLNKQIEPPLMYILTGSNQAELRSSIGEYLVGRTSLLYLSSFTQLEINNMQGKLFNPDIDYLLNQSKELTVVPNDNNIKIFNRIFIGGLPEILNKINNEESYFKSYIETFLNKEVSHLINKNKLHQFKKLMELLSLRTGTQINKEDLCSKVEINKDTLNSWLDILEASGIIFFLYPFSSNLTNRLVKTPKLYFYDTGLCSYLSKVKNPILLSNCVLSGQFFETYVVSEIVKSFINHNIDYSNKLFYYRDIDQHEIDLLYIDNDEIYPIEIKESSKPSVKSIENFKYLKKFPYKIKNGLVICESDAIRTIGENCYTLPISLIGI